MVVKKKNYASSYENNSVIKDRCLVLPFVNTLIPPVAVVILTMLPK